MSLDDREELIDHLAEYIKQEWAQEETRVASFYAGEFGDEAAARSLIEKFVEYCDDGRIGPDGSEDTLACWHAMNRMLKRVLAVDMTKTSNRKGELPQVMGLVSRRDAEKRLRNHVIYRTYEWVRYNTGVPGRPEEECFDLIGAALERTKIFGELENGGLSSEQIKKIYQRTRDEIMK